MADTVSKIAKPQLRGLLHNQIKRSLSVGIVLAVATGVAMKFLYNDKRKEVHANFYKSYDIEKEFNRIRNKGLFDSCEPDA